MCIGMRVTFYETPIIPEAIKKQQKAARFKRKAILTILTLSNLCMLFRSHGKRKHK